MVAGCAFSSMRRTGTPEPGQQQRGGQSDRIDAITPAHTTVLTHLGQAGEQPTISELARRGGVTRQTMHRAVTQLVEEGLVVTAPGPGFPRSTLVALTPEGARRRGVASAILDDLELELAAHLGE